MKIPKERKKEMKVVITPSKDNKLEGIVFPSLRTAIEWAKGNGEKELHLTKIVIKEPYTAKRKEEKR
ncbi:MAG: hypothetical protein II453_07320 [Alphaproteobacteria bacterium]|nr:hypothetical protein [Alphaproteobacteria bacterium]